MLTSVFKIFLLISTIILLSNTVYLALPYAKTFNCILIGSSVVFVSYILFFYKKKKQLNKPCQSENKQDNGFLDDNEICLEPRKIEPLINIIKFHSSLSFFSMALIGKWGSGKSSYLRTLENELNNEYEIIKVNVWQLENSENITNEIRKEFDNILFESNRILWLLQLIKRLFIRDYFAVLSKYTTKSEIKATFAFEPTINASQNDFNELLREILGNKKVLLLIDELDRLESKDEIINIFKVIRYTASFDNVFVITALDMKQIENKLEDIDYIHKIFNLKYLVPNIDKDELIEYITKKMIPKFESLAISAIELNILFHSLLRNNIIDTINNYREIKNVFNNTYSFIEYLEKDSKDWNQYISFEFIFKLNLVKAVDFTLYSKLLIDKSYQEFEKQIQESKLKFISFKLKKDDPQYLDIYQQHKIYNYHISQTKYDSYIKNINILEEDFNKIIYNEKDREKFLLNILNKNQKDKKNHVLILTKIIKLMPKGTITSRGEAKILRKLATEIFVTEETKTIFIKLLKLEKNIPLIFMNYLFEELSKGENDIDIDSNVMKELINKYFQDLEIEDSKFNQYIQELFRFKNKNNIFKIHRIVYEHFKKSPKIKQALFTTINIEDIIYFIEGINIPYDDLVDDENEYMVWIKDNNGFGSRLVSVKEQKEKIQNLKEDRDNISKGQKK